MQRYLICGLMCMGLWACGSVNESNTQASVIEDSLPDEAPALLSPTLFAHGGLRTWRSFQSLDFQIAYGEGERTESFLLDLPARYERISGAGYTLGYDGINYWQVLEAGVKPKNPEFLINLQFYFFAIPFVLADPGVTLTQLPNRFLEGREYKLLKATFGEGVGVADGDQYVLYLDTKTDRLEYLLYSVTYFDASRAEKYNALHYAEWQDVQGLIVPASLKSYVWDAETETLGKVRSQKQISKVHFGMERPDFSIFARPEGAWEQ